MTVVKTARLPRRAKRWADNVAPARPIRIGDYRTPSGLDYRKYLDKWNKKFKSIQNG